MRERSNVEALGKLPIHMVGLNFYPPSKRFIDSTNDDEAFDSLADDISLVGVFVDEEFDVVSDHIDSYQLDYVQLHGGESKMYCQLMKDLAGVIKVFSIDEDFDFDLTSDYQDVDYFLFDTKTEGHGGSGRHFNWQKLREYKGSTPFLLAGGIGPDDAKNILEIKHEKFVGVDLNSKFEISPATKNISLIMDFIKEINQ